MPVRIVLAAVIGLLLSSGVAQAAAPGRNGRIAFERDGAVWVAAPDGSGQRVLIADADAPAWSADGRRLAFDRGGQVWVADADGAGQRQVTTGGGSDPTWSPDGTRLAYERDARTWAVGLDGSGEQRISPFVDDYPDPVQAVEPDWSPDGAKIAVGGHVETELFPFIATFAPDGTGWAYVNDGSDDPEWAPTGGRLAWAVSAAEFHHDGMRVAVDGAPVSPDAVVDSDGNFVRYVNSRWPAWSPDGTTLAYQSDLESDSDVWAYHFADGTTTKLIANASEPDWQPLVADCGAVRAHPRRLSPDRRWHRVRLRGADVRITGVSSRRGAFVVPGRPVVWLRGIRGRAYVISFAGEGCEGSVTVRVRR